MNQPIYKAYRLRITATGLSTLRVDLDSRIKTITGLAVSSDRPDLLFLRGTQQLTIGGAEITPAEYESKMMMSGINVAPDEKYLAVRPSLPVGNAQLELRYTDRPAGASALPVGGYEITLHVRGEA